MLSVLTSSAIAALFISLTTACTSYTASSVVPFAPNKHPRSVDQGVANNGTYYLSDRTNNVVHVIDIALATEVTHVKGFAGAVSAAGKVNNSISGPNGLVLLQDRNELYVGDANGTIRVVSTQNNTIIANISTGAATRADEMAYDSKSATVVVTNPNEIPPYISVVDATKRTVIGKITFDNASGLEQPAFDASTGTFYVSVPSTGAHPGGEIAALNLTSMAIGQVTALQGIQPAGIVFGPNQHLFVSASQDQILKHNQSYSVVLDMISGNVIANISGIAGVDQVAYDAKANLYFASAYQDLHPASADGSPKPVLAVINATTNQLAQTIPTDNVTAHSVAVDSSNNRMLVPLTSIGGIQIYDLNLSTAICGNTTNSTTYPTSSSSAPASTTASGATSLGPKFVATAVTVSIALLLLGS